MRKDIVELISKNAVALKSTDSSTADINSRRDGLQIQVVLAAIEA